MQDALKQSGATEQEIKDILERAAKGELSGEAVDDLMTKVLTAKNIARDEFDGMVKLQESTRDPETRQDVEISKSSNFHEYHRIASRAAS